MRKMYDCKSNTWQKDYVMQKELENCNAERTRKFYSKTHCLQFNKYLRNSKTGSSNTCIPFKAAVNVKYKMQQKRSRWKMTYFLSPHAPRSQAIAGNTFAGNTPRGISKRKYVSVRRPGPTVYMLFCHCKSRLSSSHDGELRVDR